MLLQQQRGERFVYAFEFSVESAVAKGNLGDNRLPFDIVMVVKQCEIKELNNPPP